ncbi:MAG: FAD binding domain-containing protein [Acidobacteriota bacterium]|nr:FAD binding domain-containing protein [Acidobacteriota bacterium]
MIKFILNNQTIETDLPKGTTVLDFVRYHKNLKGTKIGCREGDCGACAILVGELNGDAVEYRTQTSCLMPLANARGKHIVTVEGINKTDGNLTEVQQALVDESGTQCGFCTVGFVMSLTGFALDETPKTNQSAISSIDGNICRCTGYKSIERAATSLTRALNEKNGQSRIAFAIEKGIVPRSFADIKNRLETLQNTKIKKSFDTKNLVPKNAEKFGVADDNDDGYPKTIIKTAKPFVGGGTDLYVQNPEEMVYAAAENLFDDAALREIKESDEFVEIGASVVVTDLLVSPIFQNLFPNLYKHLKLVSSTPIRNMATIAGNFINASPIGDMTAWFLALNASIVFNDDRELPLRELYLGYKTLAKRDEEFITKIRFRKTFTHFNFEKVSKRTFLDISSVNTAISLEVENNSIKEAHVSAGGVAPIPLYLRATSEFLRGKEISEETISEAIEILQTEISPISDVRGSAEYKRLLLCQLFTAHFVELFGYQPL